MPQSVSSPSSREGSSVIRDAGLLDPRPEPAFDRLTGLAARVLHAPIAVLTLFDGDRAFIKSRVGPAALLDAPRQCPRAEVPCAPAAELDEPLVIGDVREDLRIRDLPLATTLKVVGYAGVALKRSTGQVVGVLSVADTTRRVWTEDDVRILSDLSASMLTEIEWRIDASERTRAADTLRQNEERFRLMVEESEQVFFYTHDLEGRFEYLSPSVNAVLGYTPDELLGRRYNVLLTGDPSDAMVEQHTNQTLEAEEEHSTYSAVTRHKDGRIIVVEVVESALVRGGEVVGVQGLARDITERRHAEEKLRERTAYFEQLFESAPEAVVLLDNDHQILRINREFTRMFGYTAREAVGQLVEDLVVPDDLRDESFSVTERLRRGETVGARAVRRRKDGSPVHVSILGTPIRVDGNQVALYGIYRDITDQVVAEEAVYRSETHFRSLIERSADVVGIIDAHGTLRYTSPSVEWALGYTPEEIVGRSGFDLVHPDDRAHAEKMLLDGLDQPVGSRTIEFRIRHKSGEWRIYEATARNLLHDPNVEGIVITSRDTTARKETEDVLRRNATILSAIRDSVVVTDLDGVVTYWNTGAEHLFGWEAEEMLGKSLLARLPEEMRAKAREEQEQVLARQELHGEQWDLRKDGTRILTDTRVSLIRDGSGNPTAILRIARDLSDEKLREAQLRRIERMASLGTLLGGVAHELNNPLTSIKSFSQLMMLDDRQGEDREAIEIIHRESDRAAKIVADLRVIARQAQEEELQRAAVDLNEVVRHVLKVRRYAMETQNIELREDLAQDLFPVWADRSRLEQVVLNLLVNAEQAVRSATGPRRLIIRTRPSRRAVLLAVIDSGAGIPAEHLDRIFDPFWTTKEPGEGMGLGLSLVHSIITEHGGEIRVESEVGKGAAFTVVLPWSTHIAPPVHVEATPERKNNALRVLLVEDEAPIRVSVTRFLERRGHHVDQAAEAAEALRLLDQNAHYDLIVSDLRMPGLGGDELFTRLRAQGGGMERRMIFVTGDAASEEAEQFLAEAGVPVLLKPFALTDIAEAIERQASRLSGTSAAERS